MGFMEEYNKLKKKRKDETESKSSNNSFINEYQKLKEENPIMAYSGRISPAFSVDPTIDTTIEKSDSEKAESKEKKKWYQSGEFEDGYQFGDIAKTILGAVKKTSDELSNDISPYIHEPSWVGNKVMAGVNAFNKSVTGTADVLLGKPLQELGWKDNPISSANNLYSNMYDSYNQKAEEIAKENWYGVGHKYLGEAIESTVAAVPNAILALMTAGSSVGATTGDLATKAAYEGGNLLTKSGLTIEGMMKDPQYWLSFAQTYGSDYEEAKSKGADDATAAIGSTISSLINAGIEIGFDGASGIQGLPEKVKQGDKNAILEWVKSSIEEGNEEVLQDFVSNIVSKTMYDKDTELANLEDMAKDWSMGATVGAVLGGGQMAVQGAINSTEKAIQAREDSKLTENEQKVVDKVVQDRIEEAQKKGDVSNKEKAKIRNEVVNELKKGYISTDTIEEVLGGETYKSYKDIIDSEDSAIKELSELYDGEELQQQIDDIIQNSNRFHAKDQLGKEVQKLVAGDRLSESYNERIRRSQGFESDLTKYDSKQRKVIQNAIDSGILNNTNKTHEFVDMIAKISADKGVLFDFTNNAKLKESGFAIEGKTINGLVTNDGVALNIQSSKSLNSVVGHEITHVLEGTDLYDELQQTLFEYAKSRKSKDSKFDSEYKERLYNTRNIYKNVNGYEGVEGFKKIKREVAADLVGDYLFTDEDFVNNLSANHRNIFQKIYDEIKYLYKVATAGSEEARELEKVKRAFDKAYREGGKWQIDSTENADTQYSLVEDQKTIDFLENQDYITTYKAMSLIDGKLYPPMASQTYVDEEYTTKKGEKKTRRVRKLKDPSILGRWQKADESIDIAEKTYDEKKGYSSFDLLKSNGKTTGGVAYNPYEHTSNIVLNDQFSEAYQRPELVTVEYHIPVSELTSGYKAKYAKDPVGLANWKAGGVAQNLKNSHRDVYLTRWSKPIRVLSDSEVAQKYKEILDNESGISVPWNVVTPSLRVELEKIGVPIDYSDIKAGGTTRSFEAWKRGEYDKNVKTAKYSLSDSIQTESELNSLKQERTEIEDQIDMAFYNDLSDSEIRNLKNRLYKVNADIDKIVAEERNSSVKTPMQTILDNLGEYRRSDLESLAEQISEGAWDGYEELSRSDLEDALREEIQNRDLTPLEMQSSKFGLYVRPVERNRNNSGNVQYSISDSDGNQLSEAQQEYFKYSKVRDANGNLLKVYHGTPRGGFNEFSHASIGSTSDYGYLGRGFYFTSSERIAKYYAGYLNSSEVKTGYVNITNPYIIPTKRDLAFTLESIMGKRFDGEDADYERSVAFTEWLKDNGYDGVICKNEIMALNSNQFKNIDNLNPTADPDIRFSLSEPVEETKDLIALHNVREDKLMDALRLGGLPSPSIAITKSDIVHDNYGSITMILSKDSIDPQADSRNKVYGSDAWTPTSSNARTEYEVKYDKMRNFEAKISDLSKQIAGGAFSNGSVVRRLGIEDVTDNNAARLAERLANFDEVRAAYLSHIGKSIEPEYKKKVYNKFGNKALQTYIDRVGVQHLASVIADSQLGEMAAIRAEEETVRQIIRDHYAEERSATLNKRPELKESRIDKFMENNVSVFTIEDFVKDAWKFYEEGGAVTEEIDRLATSDKLREAANTKDVIAWLEPQIEEFLGEPGIYNGQDLFDARGNRKSFAQTHYTYTAENIVKAMQQVSARGETYGEANANTIIATATPSYNSISEIHADKGRLKVEDKEVYDQIIASIDDSLKSIERDIMRTTKHHADNTYEEGNIIGSIIAEAATGNRTVTGVRRTFAKEDYRISEEQAKRILHLYDQASTVPTGYFEAKPERVVGFDEVAVVVIPYDADTKLKQELLNNGLSIAEYDPNVEGDRQKVVNQFEEYKFSLSDASETPKTYGNYNVYGKDIALEEAPIRRTAPVQKTVAETKTDENILPDDYALPAPEEDIAPIASAEENTVTENVAPMDQQITAAENVAPIKTKGEGTQEDNVGKQRSWVETSTESEPVNREILPDDLNQSAIYYQPISNKKTLNNANARLGSMGYEASVSYFNSQFANQKVSLDDIALGERLIQEAVKAKDYKTAGELIQNVAILGTELGQKVQALSIIQRLTPAGQLKMIQKTVERGKTKGDKSFADVEVTQEMTDEILKTYNDDGSYNQADLDKAVEDVKQKIAGQMAVTKMEKVNAWRYLSMLGNPKTHIRNIVSNIAMKGTAAVKNAIARTVEDIAPIKDRTRTWKQPTDDVKEFAKITTSEMKDVITGGSKYSETSSIKAKRDIFKNKILNKVYEFNSELLENEDWAFSKSAFKNAFQEYLTANGIKTKADIKENTEIVEKAKLYATEQAQIETFRQYSWLANKINEIERRNTATNMVVGSILPFKKTPINIAKAGLNYSPLGFAKTLTYDISQVKKGNMNASTLVDHLAQNITGTGLTLVGYMLASMGILNGSGDDDKEGTYDYQLGKQSYSVTIGDSTFSLSWLSPTAMPLFVGANAYEQLVEGNDWNGDVVIQTLAQTLDPLSEMSFLSSLDSVLSSYDSGIQKFAGIGETMVQNYATQFVPTLSSQLAATIDDTKRSTKVAGDSGFKAFDETINKLIYKIPFLRETLEPSTDIWGNEVKQSENVITRALENFIAPYSKRDSIASAVDKEIKTLYAETGDNGIIPSVPYNYINYDNEKYKMSANEYTKFKKTYGQTASSLMESLFNTTTYKNATSEEKAEMVNRVYDYASDQAKREYLAKEGVDYTNATKDGVEYYKENSIKGAIENDMTVDEYDFATQNPERYDFLNSNGISYAEFNASEETRDAYNWAYKNPDKYTLSKAIANDVMQYRKYTGELYDIKADKDSNGKTISGSRKEKVIDYIDNLDADYGEKIILFKSEYPSDDTYNYEIIDYLNSRNDISYEEMETILKELGFTVMSDGSVRW